MKLLALDQASKTTGYSLFEEEELSEYNQFTISSSLSLGKRLSSFWDKLNDLYEKHKFNRIVFEDIQLQAGNVKTYKMLAMIQAIIILWCDKEEIEYEIYSPSHWRKILKEKFSIVWGKKRQEQKQAAIDFVIRHEGKEVSSDVADSICLGRAYIIENKEEKGAF